MKKVIDFLLSVKFYGPIIYIIVGIAFYTIISGVVNKIGKLEKRKNHKKRQTIVNLINNVIKYLIVLIIVLMILELYGVNTTSILASLGVIGLIVGLAFQDTIKNMLAGILIILDDRYNVGDTVKINDFTGEVINLGLQSTKVKNISGNIYTINNSSITSVINYSEVNSTVYLDIPVSYKTDIYKLEKVLTSLKPKVEKIENVVGSLELLGVDSFNASDISYKVSISTKPYKYFNVKREFFKLIKITFDKEGIEIPYTQIDLHIKDQINKEKVLL